MKKYAIAIVLIILAGIAYLGWSAISNKNLNVEEENQLSPATTTEEALSTSTAVKTGNPEVTQSEKDKAWEALQKYLSFAKNKDLAGVTSLSYQLSEDCKNASKDPKAKENCEAKMWSVYLIGSEFKKEDFKNIWSDGKQIILSGDYIRLDTETTAGMIRAIIYFVKVDGKIKVLSFNPGQGAVIQKGNLSEKELAETLNKKTKDGDRDGIEDIIETCEDPTYSCNKSDPNKRDTDGDGYWDGIEALFY